MTKSKAYTRELRRIWDKFSRRCDDTDDAEYMHAVVGGQLALTDVPPERRAHIAALVALEQHAQQHAQRCKE